MSEELEIREKEVLCTTNDNDELYKEPDVLLLVTGSFYRDRALKTVVLLLSLIMQGMAISLLGSTFVDLEERFQCDASSITLVMPISSAGVIAASLMTIFRLNRLSVEVTMIVSIIAVALVTAIWTAVSSVYWFLGLSVLHGFFAILVTCEMQPYFLKLWDNHRLQRPLLLAIYAFLTFGLAVGPLAVIPFLADRSPSSYTVEIPVTEIPDDTEPRGVNATRNLEQVLAQRYMNSTNKGYTGNVNMAFVAIGLPLLLPAFLYAIICVRSNISLWRNTAEKHSRNSEYSVTSTPRLTLLDRNTLVVVMLVFYMLASIVEFVPLSFLTLYVTVLLDWRPPQSTLINSAFNGALCVGRFLVIPVSLYLRPRTLLLVNLTLVLGGASFLLMSTVHYLVVWIGISILGLGISNLFGTMLLWLSESIGVTDRMMAAIIISSSLGMIVGPAITGQLFVNVSPVSMTAVVFVSSIMITAIYVILRILESRRVDSPSPGSREEKGRKQ